jgi:flagellar hook assembly protein FlgD
VRTIDAGSSYGQGTHVFGWDGLDDANQPAPDGAYWVVSSGPGHNWAELVFKGP